MSELDNIRQAWKMLQQDAEIVNYRDLCDICARNWDYSRMTVERAIALWQAKDEVKIQYVGADCYIVPAALLN